MVPPDLEDDDAAVVEAFHLLSEEPRRLHRRLVAIVEVAGNDEGVDPLVEAEVDDGHECLTGRVSDEGREIGVPHSQRAERRIEMDVRRMDEAKRHGGGSPSP